MLEALSASQMYRDYERAFTEGTGLPLRLQGPNLLHVVRYAKKQENPFCALMAKTDERCTPSSAQCYALQCRLEEEAQFAPRTLKSFAGLCETAEAICAAAERFGADILCIGSHTRSAFTAKVLGSVALAVLQSSSRPVLVVWPPVE